MSDSRQFGSMATLFNAMGFSGAASDAIAHGAEIEKEAKAGREKLKNLERIWSGAKAAVDAGRKWTELTGGVELPERFIPIKAQRNLLLMGRWPRFRDNSELRFSKEFFEGWAEELRKDDPNNLSAANVEMAMRLKNSSEGDPEAQLQMGEMFEKGTFGIAPDSNRAFFWYYRAGLNGSERGREHAVRLTKSTEIDPVTAQEPALVYPGDWRISEDNFAQGTSVQLLTLASNGSISGRVEGFGGTAGEAAKNLMDGDPIMGPLFASAMKNLTLSGKWRYDKLSARLLLNTVASFPGVPPQIAEISLIGIAKEGEYALFGTDEKAVTYCIEPLSKT